MTDESRKTPISIQRFIPLIMLVGIYLVLSMISPTFLQFNTIYNLLQQNAAVGIIALGASMVLITGGMDFTSGMGLAMAGITAAKIYMATGQNILVLVISGLLVGAAIGCMNGLLITKLKLQPFIATLAMMTVLKGLTMIVAEANTPHLVKADALFIGGGSLLGLPFPFFIFVFMALLTGFIMNKTSVGVAIFALGGNEEAARFAGINITKTKIFVYVYAGICAGLASLITISRVVIVMPNIDGTFLLDGIASAVIGGTSVSGGKGTVFGTVIGVFIIGIISTALTYLKVPAVYQEAAKGAFIIFALALDAVMSRMSGKGKQS